MEGTKRKYNNSVRLTLLDLVHVESIFISDQVDCETQMSETAGATNTMQIGLRAVREVEVDHDID